MDFVNNDEKGILMIRAFRCAQDFKNPFMRGYVMSKLVPKLVSKSLKLSHVDKVIHTFKHFWYLFPSFSCHELP